MVFLSHFHVKRKVKVAQGALRESTEKKLQKISQFKNTPRFGHKRNETLQVGNITLFLEGERENVMKMMREEERGQHQGA